MPIGVSASDNLSTLLECRPSLNFKSNVPVDPFTRETLMGSYSGIDFPNQSEWDACEVAASKTIARSAKLNDLNEKGIEHICRTSGLCYDSWNELVIAFHDWSSMAPAARQATASYSF
jgi:hypothetical protein